MNSIQFSIILLIFGFSLISAQMGINTNTPLATLDIAAKNATGTSTNVDGILVPRVDRQRAQNMSSVPVSTMIYVNSIATGTQAGTAANIDITGYYYYNGTSWIKLNPMNNIYTSDGPLSGVRSVTTNGNTVNFVNGTSNVGIITTATEGRFSAKGPTRGTLTISSGTNIVDTYVDNTNAAQINTSGTSTKLSIGTTNATPLALKTNGTDQLTLISKETWASELQLLPQHLN